MQATNSLAKSEEKRASFSVFMTNDIVKRKINEIVGGASGQRFMTAILSAVTNNLALQECDQMSVLNCAFLGEGLKLSPSPQLGQYYMVPYNDNKRGCKVAQFQMGYKGYLQLAIRSGYYKKINVLSIKQGELVNFNPLEEEITVKLIENEVERENASTIGYYAMFEYLNGFKKALYWSFEKMQAHADRFSPAYSAAVHAKILDGSIPQADMWKYSSFWYKSFDDMAMKTMLRQLISKWGIMSVDMLTAIENDDKIISADGARDYVAQDDAVQTIEGAAEEIADNAEVIEQGNPFD